MRLAGYRLPIVLGVFVVSLGLLALSQKVVYQYRTITPLETELLAIPAVQEAAVRRTGQDTVVSVTLDAVSNIQKTYQKISEIVEQRLGPGAEVTIKDNRSPELEAALRELNFVLHQGLATGRYAEMAQSFENYSTTLNLEQALLYLDDHRLYVQLHRGDKYLYEVYQRPLLGRGDG